MHEAAGFRTTTLQTVAQPDCAYQPANPSEVMLICQVQVAIPISQGYATVMGSNQAGIAKWQPPTEFKLQQKTEQFGNMTAACQISHRQRTESS